jgi:5-(carboxyamino)imidazole ribonucleotide synthase
MNLIACIVEQVNATPAEQAATRRRRPTVGIVGGGQLALMLFEASLRLDLDIRVLAARADDPTVGVVPDVRLGDPHDRQALADFADGCDVVTFDHELVDPTVLAALEESGVVLRPGASTMAVAIDKLAQHRIFRDAGLPVPETIVAADAAAVRRAADVLGGPVVVKLATGGYDGRGVADLDPTHAEPPWLRMLDRVALVQPRLAIEHELAVVVVRGAAGDMSTYPVVATVQHDGMCRLVHVPSGAGAALEQQAGAIARQVADLVDAVGIVAVEFFVVDGRLLVNEIATRPHNSGHLTIESSVTSQFENHLRAVTGQPLGATDPVVAAAAMVNLVGSVPGATDPSDRVRVPSPAQGRRLPADAAVHLYRKTPRPGRKLGHVTAVAESLDLAVSRARRAASDLEAGGTAP